MRIAFGTDEETEVTESVVRHLEAGGHRVEWVARGRQWPEVGRAVGDAVASGTSELGVVCCTTGTGVSMAANKVRGVRAALCTDAETAAGARRWNDANVMAFGLRLTSAQVASELTDAFLATAFDDAEAEAVGRLEDGGGC